MTQPAEPARAAVLPWADAAPTGATAGTTAGATGGTTGGAPAASTGGPRASSIAPADRERALAVLAAGGVIGLPTETVYGLAVRADLPAAVERLRAIKARSTSQALTWHVGRLADLDRPQSALKLSPPGARSCAGANQ